MNHKIIFIGATGAVGGETLKTLIAMPSVSHITILGRSRFNSLSSPKITQHIVDLEDPNTYREHIKGHNIAISTLGIGEPSKVSREVYEKIDKDLVLAFAHEAKAANIGHFQALVSVGADAQSRSFFLRIKGELEEGIKALNFERTSFFHPSMILTPTNRYGFSQALTLKIWPLLTPLLFGPLRKFRGIKIETLGMAIAKNINVEPGQSVETLEWDDFQSLGGGL